MKITSPHHPLVKHLTLLRKEKKYRLEQNALLLQGRVVIEEVSSRVMPRVLVIEQSMDAKDFSSLCSKVCQVPFSLLQKITGLKAPPSVVAEFPMPLPTSMTGKQRVVVLDQTADPGNVGTLLRSALAFGWQGVVFTPGSVDPFNDKVLRASRGALFFLPFQIAALQDALPHDAALWVADARGLPLSQLRLPHTLYLVLGHETKGVSPFIKERGELVSIPTSPLVESLNVAVAGSVFMWHFSPLKG